MIFNNPYATLLQDVCNTLSSDEYFIQSEVKVITENAKDLEYEIDKVLTQALGTLVIIRFARSNIAGPTEVATFELMITENPMMNRSKANYATTLDILHRSRCLLDGASYHLTNHEQSAGENLLQAIATYECLLNITIE